MTHTDHYKTLGIKPDASPKEIKSAYRRCAKASHPDLCEKGNRPFREVQAAYDVLSDAGRRETYDATRPAKPPNTKIVDTHAARPRSPVESMVSAEPIFDERVNWTHRPNRTHTVDPFWDDIFDELATLRVQVLFDPYWPW